MTKIGKLRMAATVAVVALAAAPLMAAPVVTDRLAALTGSGRAVVAGTVHPLAQAGSDLGLVPDSTVLNGMTLYFARTSEQQAALDALLEQQMDPASPLYHQWLTPAQFGAQFGMSANDIASVTAWLAAQGFTVDHVAESANVVTFTGTAGQVRASLGTEIHKFLTNGETHFANVGNVQLPSTLAAAVIGVGGLNDFKLKPHVKVQQPQGAPEEIAAQFTSGISGNHYLGPGDVATIYDVKPLYTSYTGTGEYIGIIGQTDVVLGDIASYRAAAGLPANSPTVVLIPGSKDPGYGYGGDLVEADLDLELAGGIAYNANLVFVNSTNVFNSITYAITNQVTVGTKSVLLPILSISYGGCESGQGSSTLTAMEAVFQQAATQGQTIVGSSGDVGATDCQSSSSTSVNGYTTTGLAVDYPASSAYVTGVGGTEFNDGTAVGATTYWNGTVSGTSSTDITSSAVSYIPEVVWNDTPTALLAVYYGEFSAGGGGISSYIARPSWQTGVTGIVAGSYRLVPDIALSASGAHDPYLMCTETELVGTGGTSSGVYTPSCSSGFRIYDPGQSDNNGLFVVGGTSAGAPAFAGMLALMEQKLGGGGLGVVNKSLYTLAANSTTYASAFHDITSGTNAMPCSAGTGCTSGVAGYSAGTGYDMASGLGSVDAYQLSQVIGGSKPATTTAVTYLPTPPVIGQTVNLTATVTKSSGTATPTGTVTFTIDGTVGSAVTVASGAATTSTSFASGGTHMVTAQYSGDTNYFGSIGSATLSNFSNSGGAVATSVILSASNNNFPLYAASGTLTLTATVTTATSGTLGGTTMSFIVGTTSTAVALSGCTTTSCTASWSPTVTPANGFTAGTDTITAMYNGNTNYQQSTSSAATLTVLNPSFTVTAPAVTVASSPVAAPTYETITITSKNGFTDTVNVVVTAGTFPGCAIQSGYAVTPSSGGTATVTLELGNCAVVALHPYDPLGRARNGVEMAGIAGRGAWRMGADVLLGLMVFFGLRRRVTRMVRLTALLLAVAVVGFAGCSSGGSGAAATTLTPGSYTMGVIATDSTNTLISSQTATIAVTVQ